MPILFLLLLCGTAPAGELTAVRASILHFIDDPFYSDESKSYEYIQDGMLIIEDGKIKERGSYEELKKKYKGVTVTDYSGKLILPGFIDTHIHYPQTEMIASYGEQIMEWLNRYTFPTESRFRDKKHAKMVASFFMDELLRNGTTTALIFATVHPESTEAIFEEALARNMRVIAGKVMMDRKGFTPDSLYESARESYDNSKRLIKEWHGKGRLQYAITPRFAITSTDEQLRLAGELKKEFPDVYLHTHLSENIKEIETVASLFPNSKGYLDVYDRYGLVTPKSIFAHGVHLTGSEMKRLSEAKSAIAFCPTSNLFLGSGLFRLHNAKSRETPINVGLGTDVGAGTSFSIIQTANEAYKVAQLQNDKLSAFRALFLATLGGARALSIDDKVGNFAPGREADFIVLDYSSTPLQAFRNKLPDTKAKNLHDKLFALMILGDDRAVVATYVYGRLLYRRPAQKEEL